MASGSAETVLESISQVERQMHRLLQENLPTLQYTQIGEGSYRIARVSQADHHTFILTLGEKVPIGRSYQRTTPSPFGELLRLYLPHFVLCNEREDRYFSPQALHEVEGGYDLTCV